MLLLRSLFTGLVAANGLITGGTAHAVYGRQPYTSGAVIENATSTPTASTAYASSAYQLQGAPVDIYDTSTQSITLQADSGLTWDVANSTDITSWFVDWYNNPAFGESTSVAQTVAVDSQVLTIRLDASNIVGFSTNGPSTIKVWPPAGALKTIWKTGLEPASTVVGRYSVPKLSIKSDIYGTAYTHAKSTLKEMFGFNVTYNPNTSADLLLELPDLEDTSISVDNATVTLVDGDGYYTSEYILKSDKLTGSWKNGRTSYSLKEGDVVINTGDYLISDSDSGREWSCLGGDGQGNYIFNLMVAGITYNGLPVASQTFRTHIYIHGYNYTSDAATKYGAGTIIYPEIEPLSDVVPNPPERGAVPVFTWIGEGEKPNLADTEADNFYITWPVGTDASNLEACDVQVVLSSVYGDQLALGADIDFAFNTSSAETQISITVQNWPFQPIYRTMTITVDATRLQGNQPSVASLTKIYEIASVYVYLAQQGGGGTTVDGTVTAYSFYGLAGLSNVTQITEPANYTLSTAVNGVEKYYAGTTNSTGVLVNSTAAATVYDGSGLEDMNLQLIGNTVYITTRVNATATKTINGKSVTFTKAYSGGATLSPDAADPSLAASPGYFLNNTATWIEHEKWAWQSTVGVGWGGVWIEPFTGKFEWSMAPGSSQQFTANVSPVTWSILGNVSNDTDISSTGNLTVADGETSQDIAVIATSLTDKSYEGIGTVSVAVTDSTS